MARKSKAHLLAVEPHEVVVVKVIPKLYCPHLKCKGTKDVLSCLYKCPKARLLRCPEYLRIYPELATFEIDPMYIEKYGAIAIPVPAALRKRRRRRTPIKEETE